jgi:hypothetical protein
MDGSRFDHLTRLAGPYLTRRAGLGWLAALGLAVLNPAASTAKDQNKKKKKGKRETITICYQNQTLSVRKRGWQGRYAGATQGACPAQPSPPGGCTGCTCCAADACFAATVNPTDAQPTSFDCCPADKLCRSPKPPFPDQCCYPDEYCDPTLVDKPDADSVCCRPCNGQCCKVTEECRGGKCAPADTARLPRTRRP